MESPKVLMLGADRSVHGGVSAVVNNYYEAGLDKKIELKYIGTMVDGTKIRKLFQAVKAYIKFLFLLPWCNVVQVHMSADASFYRKKIFIDTAVLFRKKVVIHQHGGNFHAFYYGTTSPSVGTEQDESSQTKQSKLRNAKKTEQYRHQMQIRETLNKADLFIVLSEEWKEFFTPIVTKIPIQVLHNAIAIPEANKTKYDDHNMIFLGRICKDKGIDELLLAFDEVIKSIPDAKLYLAGMYEDESYQEKVEKRAPAVEYLGWIDAQTRQIYLKDICSVFILPTYYEGQPISLLEAMAQGNAVISTNVGGIPQIVKEEPQNGILIPAKDVEELKKTILALLPDAEKKAQIGQQARIDISEEYAIENNIERLLAMYRLFL